jgi:quaternary ammonium compound-resistance protein SugE
MAWVILIVSGAFESMWAVALGKSAGFSRPWPTVVFTAALIVSMGGLAVAMRSLPIGTSYAVWVSIGAALTVGYSMATGDESVSILKIALLLGLVGCVVGLKLAH